MMTIRSSFGNGPGKKSQMLFKISKNDFKNKIEDCLQDGLFYFYTLRLSQKNGLRKKNHIWDSEYQRYLTIKLPVLIETNVIGLKNKKLSIRSIIIYMQKIDAAYRITARRFL